MVRTIDITNTWNLVGSVETYTLRTYHDDLCLTEKLQECESNSPNKPPFAINYLQYYNSHEPVTSWIIRHLFAYTFNGKHPFFESFANTFLQKNGFRLEWIESPIIDKEHEYKGIDILVREKQYALIIENKLKGADFQLNQLARYIATMRNEGYSDSLMFIVILPKDNISNDDLWNSVWRLPQDWQSTTQSRKCRIDNHICWCDVDDFRSKKHCDNCESLKEVFESRTLFIHKDLSEWLYNSITNNTLGVPDDELRKQYVLISAALQFVDFLNYIYNTRENDKFKMDIQKFLGEQLKLNDIDLVEQLSLVEDKKSDVEELASQLDDLYWSKIKEYITAIREKYHVPIVREDDEFYFHCEIIIDGISVILSLSHDRDGDFCMIETKPKKRLPKFITEDFDISEELNDIKNRSNCIWKYGTSYRESLMRFDRVLGRLLDIKNNL